MRGGFKGMVGQGPGRRARTPMQRIWDALFWIVILALLGFFAYRRFR
jgi:apolipoprotein N-acyltransferase